MYYNYGEIHLPTTYEYHIYQVIPLHSCDYLTKNLIKTNVATDEGDSWNEMWHWTNNEIGVAVQGECELNSWPDSSVG